MSFNNKNTVMISGQEYAFKTGAESKTIQAVADYINEKMNEVESAGVDTSSQLRIAVLDTMNITAELFDCKKTKDEVIDKVESKARAISEYIEDKISDIESSNQRFIFLDTVILKGKDVSSRIKENLAVQIYNLKLKGIIPRLAAIIVGDNPASKLYVNSKAKTFKNMNRTF